MVQFLCDFIDDIMVFYGFIHEVSGLTYHFGVTKDRSQIR